MRTIAIVNLKGGVAKTATTVNVAAILQHYYHKRVLVVDADSQGNTTEFFGGAPEKGNLAEVLRQKDLFPDQSPCYAVSIQPSNFAGIDLLAASDELMDLDLTAVKTETAQAGALRDLTAQLADQYDFCLVDCPPAFNAASAAAMIAADEVVIPIKLDAFSLRGMTNLLQQIKNMQAINPKLKLAGLLPTMWYKSDRILQAEATLRASGLPVFPHIRKTDKVDEMTFVQQPLYLCSPKSAAGVDYRRFVEVWLEGGKRND